MYVCTLLFASRQSLLDYFACGFTFQVHISVTYDSMFSWAVTFCFATSHEFNIFREWQKMKEKQQQKIVSAFSKLLKDTQPRPSSHASFSHSFAEP